MDTRKLVETGRLLNDCLIIDTGNDQIVNLDLLTYAGNLENLAGIEANPD